MKWIIKYKNKYFIKIKKFNEDFENIDPFSEEDWDEEDSQIFIDEETGFELEWSPTKKTMDGWFVRNIGSEKLNNYINNYFKRVIANEGEFY